MKRRTFCKAAAVLAAGTLLPLPAMAAQASAVVGSAAEDDYYLIRFRSDFSARSLEREFYYGDALFEHSAMQYDHTLALATLALTCAAQNTWESDDLWWLDGEQGRENNLADAFHRLGFANTQYLGYEQNMNTVEAVDGCAMAQKTLEENGSRTTIFAVILRPSIYGAEWADNLKAGPGTGHEGFIASADRLYEAVRAYTAKAEQENELGTIKMWLGGYSRGAAIANLLAAKIAKEIPAIRRENLFAYTFAAPVALTAADRPDLQQDYDNNHTASGELKDAWSESNIFNLISSGDIVPRVLPEEWGYHRNGNDRFLPATKIKAECVALDEREKTIGGTPLAVSQLASGEETTQVVEVLLRVCPDQLTYHEKYEAAYMDMVRCGLMRSEEEVTQGVILSDEEVVERLRLLPDIQKMEQSKVLKCVKAASAMSRPVLERFGAIVPLRAQQVIIPVLAVGMCHEIEADTAKVAAYYIAGMVGARGNLTDTLRAAACHYPENYITLMEYYGPEEHGMQPYTRQ